MDNGGVDVEDPRLAVYRGFAETGRAPRLHALAAASGWEPAQVPAGLVLLSERRHLVLDHRGDIVMAHPFSSVPLGFAVMGTSVLFWGGCAWDSFALPHLLPEQAPALVSTRCPACARPHTWDVGTGSPPEGEQVVHFLVPAAEMWHDVAHTCGHQRIFRSTVCVDRWLAERGLPRGYVMDLTTLWDLAAHWYDGRLDRGYTRREPAQAAGTCVGWAGPAPSGDSDRRPSMSMIRGGTGSRQRCRRPPPAEVPSRRHGHGRREFASGNTRPRTWRQEGKASGSGSAPSLQGE